MKTAQQKSRDALAELVYVCDPMRDGFVERLRERYATDDLDIALAVAVGQFVSAGRHLLEDLNAPAWSRSLDRLRDLLDLLDLDNYSVEEVAVDVAADLGTPAPDLPADYLLGVLEARARAVVQDLDT